MKKLMMLTGMAFLLIGSSACNKSEDATPPNGNLAGAGETVPQFTLSIADNNGQIVYNSAIPGSAPTVPEGTYKLTVTSTNGNNPDITYTAMFTRIDAVTPGAPLSYPIVGTTTVPLATPGDYVIAISATNGSIQKTYAPVLFSASVVCNNPAALNVDTSKISVSLVGNNLYTYDATGAASGGLPPYRYAFDYTGDGSQDSSFHASPTAANAYENFVGPRSTIGLIVKDNCNTTQSVTAALTIPAGSLPSLAPGGGIEYIHGQVASATGNAATYKDVWDVGAGANYYATNNATSSPVHAVPAAVNDTAFSFVIASDKFTYGLPSSATFGMNLSLGNMTATLGADLASTSFDASGARLTSLSFLTEQVGDGKPQIKLTGGYPNCTVSNVIVKVLQVTGVPCAPGTTNAKWNNKEMHWTVEVGANYSCTNMTDATGSQVAMTGDFDGTNDLIDSCVGGGGQGGGGDFPPQF